MSRGTLLFTKAFLILMLTAFLAAGFISCKKKNPADNSDSPGNSDISDFSAGDNTPSEDSPDFYSPALDDASWVEALLIKIEEERIAEELAKMEAEMEDYQLEDSDFESDSDSEDDEDIDEEDTEADAADEAESPEAGETEEEAPELEKDPVEKFFEEQKEGKTLFGKDDRMSFFEFDNEILLPQSDQNGLSLIHSSGDNVIRTFYNKDYKLVKKEEWLIKSAADSKKLKTEFYLYSKEDGKVSEKEILTATYDEQITYNKNGLPLSSRRYNLDEENKYLIMERQWNYDSKKRLIKDYQKEYFYKDKDYKNPESFSKNYNYTYNDFAGKTLLASDTSDKNEENEENAIPPDLKYYENDVLKMHNKYSAEKGTWFSWIYFDENLSVKSYYEEDLRVRDEYYNNGKLFRTKLYQ